MKRIGWIAFSSTFVIAGIVVMILGINSLLKAKASKDWPSTNAIIQSSEIESHHDNDSGITYSAEVTYEYLVEGAKITGNKIKFGEVSSSDSSEASRYVNKYSAGKKIKAYYNTEDPYDSVLEPGVHGSTWFMPIFGLVFALFGSVFVLIGLFSKQLR
jgi:hypothetical protein